LHVVFLRVRTTRPIRSFILDFMSPGKNLDVLTSQWPASPLTNVSPPDRSVPFSVRLGYAARSSTRPKIVEWEFLRASQSESRSCSRDMCPPTQCDDTKGKYAPWCNWIPAAFVAPIRDSAHKGFDSIAHPNNSWFNDLSVNCKTGSGMAWQEAVGIGCLLSISR
jgi:hypothetical protein